MTMNIERKSENDKITLLIRGELTALTANQLNVAIRTAVLETDHLTLDFKNLEYLASAGLRVLLEAKKLLDDKGGKLIVSNVSDVVMQVFEITGFSQMLGLE